MRSVFAQTADGVYIVETTSLWGIQRKREAIAESEIDGGLIAQWRQWCNAEKDLKSINDVRVEEHRSEQVAKSFSSSLSSSKPPEGWTDCMTSFV